MFKKHTEPAALLRHARTASSLTQEELAASIGKSRAFVYRLEVGGRATLTPEIAERISTVVSIAPEALFGDAYRSRGSR